MKRSAVVLSLLATASFAGARDWPQWRGPERDGIVRGLEAPPSWPEKLERKWRVELGIGYASPIVIGDRIYLFSREAGEEVLRALTLEEGRVLWREAYPAPYRMNPAATGHGDGPKSTPVAAGGQVFTLGISGILTARQAATGEGLWQTDFSEEFPATTPIYGVALSPLVAEGKLITHIGGSGNGALVALEPTTGSELWRLEGDGPGYTSPLLVTIAGTRQVVTMTDARIVSVDWDTGELLWSRPFTTAYDQNAVTPVQHGDRLIFSGLDRPTFALTVTKTGESWYANQAWSNPEVSFYMSTPVRVGNRLFGMSHKRKGQFVALDALDGRTLWSSTGREGDNAALIVLGESILVLTDSGELFVLDPEADHYAPVRTYQVAESATWAHPAATKAGILIKDHDGLSLWSYQTGN